jgi:hypothetical protein
MISRTGLLLALVLGCGVAGGATSPGFLGVAGSQPPRAFHLRLIWASAPPSIIEVDSGEVQRVSGVMRSSDSGLWLTPVPGGALAAAGSPRSARAVLIHADGSTRFLVRATSVVGAWDAPAAWALSRRPGGKCAVRLVPGDRPAVRKLAAGRGHLHPRHPRRTVHAPAGLSDPRGPQAVERRVDERRTARPDDRSRRQDDARRLPSG